MKQPELVIEKRNLSETDCPDVYLYKQGVESDFFLIIVDGSADLEMGKSSESEMVIKAGLFSYYGVNALVDENVKNGEQLVMNSYIDSKPVSYKPEFSLKVDKYCVYLRVTRADWLNVVTKSYLLKTTSKN